VEMFEPLGRTWCRWRGSSLWEGPADGGDVRAFGKDLLSVERFEPLGRNFRQWIGASLWEGPTVGGQVRAFGKDLLSPAS